MWSISDVAATYDGFGMHEVVLLVKVNRHFTLGVDPSVELFGTDPIGPDVKVGGKIGHESTPCYSLVWRRQSSRLLIDR